MRILMTGHLGYIGTAAVPIFQARGHEVVGLDTDLYRDCTFGPEIGPAAAIPNIPASTSGTRRRTTSRASTPWCISPGCPTIPWATSTPS